MANVLLKAGKLYSRNYAQMFRIPCSKSFTIESLVGRRATLSHECRFSSAFASKHFYHVGNTATCELHLTHGPILSKCARRFSARKTDVMKGWSTKGLKESHGNSKTIGNDDDDDKVHTRETQKYFGKKYSEEHSNNKSYTISIDDDDDNDNDDDDKDLKSTTQSTRKSPTRGAEVSEFSSQRQKTGNKLTRPSRYSFKDLDGEDSEEQRWVKRPLDTSNSRVEWYAHQMVRLTSANQVDRAQELFNSMRAKKIKPTTELFNILIAGYGRAGKIRKAFHHYNNIKKSGLLPTAHTYTSLFHICGELTHTEVPNLNASKLWEEFQKYVDNQDIIPDIITYNAAMKAAASGQNLLLALDIYEVLCTNQIEPESRTYSALITACAAQGDLEKVMWVLKEMNEHDVKPDIYIFNAILRAIRDSRNGVSHTKEKTEISDEKKNNSSKFYHDTSGEEGRIRSNVIQDSPSALTNVWKNGLANSNSETSDVLSNENDGTARSDTKLFTSVEDFLQLMALNDVLPDIRTFHLLLQVAELELDEEKRVLQVMKNWKVNPDLPVLNSLIKRRALFGDVANAQEYINVFEEEFGVTPIKNTYVSLARGCRNTPEGLWLLNEMKERNIVIDATVFTKMVKNATYRNDYRYLTELLKEMRKYQVQPTIEMLELLDKAVNLYEKQPRNQVAQISKSYQQKRQHKKTQFIRKQKLGFYGFYKTWKEENSLSRETKKTIEHSETSHELAEKYENIDYDHL